jgi:FkbH-like protein
MSLPIFAKRLKRFDLLSFKNDKPLSEIKIVVIRNHSFEAIASVLNAFLGFSGFKAQFQYSSYDDALNYSDSADCDLNLIYVDLSRYKTQDINGFLADRAAALRRKNKAPILIVYADDQKAVEIKIDLSDSFAFSIASILTDLGEAAFDLAKAPYSGSRFSNIALLEIARFLGLKLIPSIFCSPLKAIVCDLDNSLYDGVLGEDGAENLKPRLALQAQIKKLKNEGFFLAIASKNEEEDVREAFEKRSDFILKFEDFDAIEINWNNKKDGIVKIAKTLNIGADSMLFIDDNPAEIQNVETTGVKTILADNEENALFALKFFPRLTKIRVSLEDSLRSKDALANRERDKLTKELSPKEYFAKLGIKLKYSIDNRAQIPRVSELLRKTNQFILSYKRYNEVEVEEFMNSPNACVITIAMSDNLSESGIIAIVLARKNGETLELDETTVSCRALGRNVESVALPFAFNLAAKKLKTNNEIVVNYKKGERNAPALSYLALLTDEPLEKEGSFLYQIPFNVDVEGLGIEIE